ncbi:sensor histidine kinase [Krasilnikovia sp. MM14-A1259]|uniref:sensor histidine kinase n=1 Tax=Krasilnikovia sp. MM14-A1259 TaxID=3373539 RepID=UPI0037F60F08
MNADRPRSPQRAQQRPGAAGHAPRSGDADPRDDNARTESLAAAGTGPAAPRVARAVITAVLFGYVLNALIFVWRDGSRGLAFLAFAICLSTAFLLQYAHSTADVLNWSARRRMLTLSAQAVVTFVPFAWIGPQAGSTAGFLAGSMLLAVPGRVRWLLFSAVGAGVLVVSYPHLGPVDVTYSVYVTQLTGLMVYSVSSLALLVGVMFAARGELARMAVARERLRVARDLHDLLGFNVSAIVLKSELAYRLLPGAADKARQQILDTSEVARRALADVQVVAGGHRPLSLAAELATARSILTAAEIEVSAEPPPEGLPERVDTVLAIVLREAATNVLRHCKARWCHVEAVVDGTQVRLRVDNDGLTGTAGGQTGAGGGSGLANLSGRLAGVGGRLTTRAEGECFRLMACAPLPATAADRVRTHPERHGPAEPGGHDAPADAAGPPWHLRMARLITVLVLSGYGLLIMVNVLPLAPTGAAWLAFAGCMAAQVIVQLVLAFWPPGPRRTLVGGAVLAVQAVATALPLLWIPGPWGSMGGFLAGSVLLVVPGWWRWAGYGAVGVTVLALALAHHTALQQTAYLVISTLLTGLVVYGISSLSGLVARVTRAREEVARLAVTQERLRVARDLHGALGDNLSAMIAKSELAYRALPDSAQRAKDEVAEVLETARRAVADVRAAASGYRHMSFAAELSFAVSTLSAAGIDVRVLGHTDAVPDEVDAVLALVLREAATNVLRHSDAAMCTIEVAGGCPGEAHAERARSVRLEVRNDGVPHGPVPDLHGATGLGDLVLRLSAIGGRVSAAADGATFRLTAAVPVTMPTPAGWVA